MVNQHLLEDRVLADPIVHVVAALGGTWVRFHDDAVDAEHPVQDLAVPCVGRLAPLLDCRWSGGLGPPPDLGEARLGS